MNNKIIYLDNNATTKPNSGVLDEYTRLSREEFYNINTNSKVAVNLKNKLEEMSLDILCYAGLKPKDYGVLYAGSATEINKAIIDLFNNSECKIVTSPYEHKSIASCTTSNFVHLKIDKKNGTVKIPYEGFPSNTKLVSVMAANNEFPVRNDLQTIKQSIPKDAIFHTDATQLFGKVSKGYPWFADLISFSTHKFNGIKGVGILIYKKSILPDGNLPGLINGTPNSTSILAHAPLFKDLAMGKMDKQDEHYLELRCHLLEKLIEHKITFKSLEPQNIAYLNFGTCLLSFPGACNLLLKKNLDNNNIIVSIGSACDTDKKGASNTIKALNLIGNDGILRVSFGNETTINDIDFFVKIMKKILPNSLK